MTELDKAKAIVDSTKKKAKEKIDAAKAKAIATIDKAKQKTMRMEHRATAKAIVDAVKAKCKIAIAAVKEKCAISVNKALLKAKKYIVSAKSKKLKGGDDRLTAEDSKKYFIKRLGDPDGIELCEETIRKVMSIGRFPLVSDDYMYNMLVDSLYLKKEGPFYNLEFEDYKKYSIVIHNILHNDDREIDRDALEKSFKKNRLLVDIVIIFEKFYNKSDEDTKKTIRDFILANRDKPTGHRLPRNQEAFPSASLGMLSLPSASRGKFSFTRFFPKKP